MEDAGRSWRLSDRCSFLLKGAAELLDADVWEQQNELGGIQDSERTFPSTSTTTPHAAAPRALTRPGGAEEPLDG